MVNYDSNAAPGWYYPDLNNRSVQVYWDGSKWCPEKGSRTQGVAQNASPAPSPVVRDTQPGPDLRSPSVQVATAVVLGVAVIGVILSMQSATIMQGTGKLWTGAALAVGAGVASIIMRSLVPSWATVLVVLAAVVAFSAASYVETELHKQADKITSDLSDAAN